MISPRPSCAQRIEKRRAELEAQRLRMARATRTLELVHELKAVMHTRRPPLAMGMAMGRASCGGVDHQEDQMLEEDHHKAEHRDDMHGL